MILILILFSSLYFNWKLKTDNWKLSLYLIFCISFSSRYTVYIIRFTPLFFLPLTLTLSLRGERELINKYSLWEKEIFNKLVFLVSIVIQLKSFFISCIFSYFVFISWLATRNLKLAPFLFFIFFNRKLKTDNWKLLFIYYCI